MNTALRRQLMTIVLAMIIPLAVLLIINNFYSINLFNRRIADSNQQMVDLHVRFIEENRYYSEDFTNLRKSSKKDIWMNEIK